MEQENVSHFLNDVIMSLIAQIKQMNVTVVRIVFIKIYVDLL